MVLVMPTTLLGVGNRGYQSHIALGSVLWLPLLVQMGLD